MSPLLVTDSESVISPINQSLGPITNIQINLNKRMGQSERNVYSPQNSIGKSYDSPNLNSLG